jgi:hypothetical protein
MNIKNKLLAILLVCVFIASVGSVVAQDVGDAADELAVDNTDETIAVDEDETLAADDDDAPAADATGEDGDDTQLTSVGIRVDILDKNIKVGDKVRVKITVVNFGDYPANNVKAGFSFTDLMENPDNSFKLLNGDEYALTEADGGYEIDFGFLGAGDTKEVILLFLATEAGTKKIFSLVTSDDSIMEPDSYFDTTITVGESAANNKVSAAKTLPEAGNPLALLAIALFCLVPLYRRK